MYFRGLTQGNLIGALLDFPGWPSHPTLFGRKGWPNRARPSHFFWQKGLGWPFPVSTSPQEDTQRFFYNVLLHYEHHYGDLYCPVHIFLEFRLVSTILGISTQLSMFRSNNPGSIRLNNLRTYFIWPTSFSKMKHVYT